MGVNRLAAAQLITRTGYPHTRGGEPSWQGDPPMTPSSYPHTRGGEPQGNKAPDLNFYRYPHTRGGEPTGLWPGASMTTGYPHTRGGEPGKKRTPQMNARRYPHTRGGEPHRCRFCTLWIRYPHTRGGEPSGSSSFTSCGNAIPTPVGVNRLRCCHRCSRPQAIPTPVGVNQWSGTESKWVLSLSPHPWG